MKKLLLALGFVALAVSGAWAQTAQRDIVVNWTAPAVSADKLDAPTGYKVELKIGNGAYTQVGTPTSTTFTHRVSDPGNTAYCARVRATSPAGDGGFNQEACATSGIIYRVPGIPGPTTIVIQLVP